MSDTNNQIVPANDAPPLTAPGPMNLQASLTFKLMKTNLIAAFTKLGDANTFIVIPTDTEKNEGMTIKEMIEDINKFLKGFDASAPALEADQMEKTLADASEAGKKDGENVLTAPDFTKIKVYLKQAFLLLQKGTPVEYAFQISVDFSQLFPKDASFFEVNELALAFWNTDRMKILARMDIIDINDLLKEDPAPKELTA